MSLTTRPDGARCFGNDLDQHDERCYCGKPATRHIFYGSGCGNVCGIHARKILGRKNMRPEPPNLVAITHPPTRECSACLGACDWHDTAWVCRDCGSEWSSGHGPEFRRPAGRVHV